MWQKNDLSKVIKMKNIMVTYKKHADFVHYGLIAFVTLTRVLISRVRPCLPDFDCNSYITMVDSIAYNPEILPHHAMRIFPSLLVRARLNGAG